VAEEITLALVFQIVQHIDEAVHKIDDGLTTLNGTVRRHNVELAVLKDWRVNHVMEVKEAAHEIKENAHEVTGIKIELAKIGAFGGSMGIVIAIVAIAAKAIGWM